MNRPQMLNVLVLLSLLMLEKKNKHIYSTFSKAHITALRIFVEQSLFGSKCQKNIYSAFVHNIIKRGASDISKGKTVTSPKFLLLINWKSMWKFLSFPFPHFPVSLGTLNAVPALKKLFVIRLCGVLPLCLVALAYLSHLTNCFCHHWMLFTFILICSFHLALNKQTRNFMMSAFLVKTQMSQLTHQ